MIILSQDKHLLVDTKHIKYYWVEPDYSFDNAIEPTVFKIFVNFDLINNIDNEFLSLGEYSTFEEAAEKLKKFARVLSATKNENAFYMFD